MDNTNTLPLILAGPILRRVTPTSINVWFACSQPTTLTLRIYDENGEQIGCSIPTDTQTQQCDTAAQPRQTTASLGLNLHLTVLEATPDRGNSTFPEETLLSYAVFDAQEQLLPEITDVCLAGNTRPNFYIASQLRLIAYGSCRKPHGPSFDDQEVPQHQDSLALLADQLADNVQQLTQRPSHLFLIGDQIYADEVPTPLMEFLQKLAVQLVGTDIPLPCGELPSTLNEDTRNAVKRACGLTSNAKGVQHLISFGEFAAMYLFVLGNRIQFNPPDDSAQDNAEQRRAKQSLRDFVASQAQVRKTLANVPTYMMFDDHDVTDDWNLNRSWYNQVHSSKSGSRVVANALAAFWGFQAWGNEPQRFSQEFIDILQDHLLLPTNQEAAKRYEFTLRKYRQWSVVLPTTPPIFMLDCRTQRDFGSFNSPPQLLDHYALADLYEAWFNLSAQNKHPSTVPVFMTGTPVFGFSVIEGAQQAAYRLGFLLGISSGKLSPSRLDIESWIANSQGFAAFLNTILYRMEYTKATFIAGDVHYSFANHATYVNQEAPDQTRTLQCLQLTSSALRNTPDAGRALEMFLANDITKVRRGHSNPETLPWWYRIFFWRFLRKNIWKITVVGIAGKAANPRPTPNFKSCQEALLNFITRHFWQWLEKRDGKARTDPNTYWITCRPNVGLVYFENGEVTQQVLLSGDMRDACLTYTVKNAP